MAIPKTLPTDPYTVLNPDDRWRPGKSELKNMPIGHLLPPLVDKVRRKVKIWRDEGYPHVSETSRALLRWWFCRSPEETDGIRYYFAQREAVESIIYLYEHEKAKVRDKYDLLRFSSGGVAPEMMEESWRRFAVKMATGSGKTKVISLLILWSYFHKTYEENSELSRNILLIAPNIIVLDRLYRDFAGLRIFREDGALPENGYAGRDWQNDFHLRLHKQDNVRGAKMPGNLYLTNIHRVYSGDVGESSAEDEDSRNYFFGEKAADIKESRADLAAIVRDTNELFIINDEAHHIHAPKLAWFRAIRDIHNFLVQKGGALSLQADFTATPKHNDGAIFPHTVSDYPLVEAIHQNIVKRPVVPDDASEAKLKERQHIRFSEKYADYIGLGVEEWRKARNEHKKVGKKAVLFLMADNTRNCDELAEYLQKNFSDLENKVLVIHTNENGEIGEKVKGKKEKELQELRRSAAEIDSPESKWRAVVSVLVLREGWDVRNVTTIVGLRAYAARSKILPEQTLGRGLRLMYESGCGEKVSVIGTAAFSEFVKEIEKEGVKLEKAEMGAETTAQAPRIIAIDRENPEKNIAELDIAVPVLSRRFYANFAAASNLKAENIPVIPAEYKMFGKISAREIIFCDVLTGEASHKTTLGDKTAQDYSNVVAYFARRLMAQFKLFSNYDFFYELMEEFIRKRLFGKTVPLNSEDTLRNLAETPTAKTLLDAMGTAVGAAIRAETGEISVCGEIRISAMRPFAADNKQAIYAPRQSAQNFVVAGNNALELDFARFLDKCADIAAFAKNYMAVGFHVEYVKTDGVISRYFPDFIVRDSAGKVWIIETKGRMDENDRRKIERLVQWRDNVGALPNTPAVGCLLVDESGFRKHRPANFAELVKMFPPDPK